MLRRGRNRRNKQSIPTEVRVTSIVKPYRADPILNFSIRYTAVGGPTYIPTARSVTRVMVLNTLIQNSTGSTGNFRLLQAVRINKITLYTASSASVEWASTYGPQSAIMVNGTSTVSPGVLISRPPKNTLAGAWSFNGINEGDIIVTLSYGVGDILDVDFSAVLCDRAAGSAVSTTVAGTAGFVYRTYFDGPAGSSAQLQPLSISSLN